MTRAPNRYSFALVQVFYEAYKGELRRYYPQGQLWKSSDPIASLFTWEVWVKISTFTISRFLYGPNYRLSVNIRQMDYKLEKMRKITQIQLGMEDKMGHFRWIARHIASNGEDVVRVVRLLGVTSQKIENNTLNFEDKAWWTMSRHQLCVTTEDNILSPIWVVLMGSQQNMSLMYKICQLKYKRPSCG